jgi:predicted  nucleic acid-binding Zn-ribbon protein
MPHQCTNCGRAFDDGSKEMLSGCPDCGGNKFQFHPSETDVPEEPDAAAEPPDPPTPEGSVARTVGSAAATVKDLVGRGSDAPDPEPAPEGEPTPTDATEPSPGPAGSGESAAAETTVAEDAAQADARSQVVSPEEIPTGGDWPEDTAPTADGADGTAGGPSPTGDAPSETGDVPSETADQPAEERPDLKELREELNDQFESIKVLKPGTYELNLMELYDREEYIIALQEDGRYTIQVPENWHD